ncbi:MAG: glycosyltransferase family 1 protein [Sphingomicrobium sp.]
MRVALFSGNYNYLREGANQALNRLVAYAERNGFKYRVYSPVTDTPAFKPAGDLVAVPSIPLPGRTEFRLAPGLPRAVREDVRRFAPDLIHLSTPDILGTRAQTFAKKLGVPVVASLHTRFETYFDFYGLGWARPPAEAHLRRFYRRCDHVLAPTPAIVAELKRLRGDEAVSLWSRGVDRDLFNPRRRDLDWRRTRGWRDEDVVVLFFGRLVLEKGVNDFVAIVQRLRALGVAVKPLVVGAGPAQGAFDVLEDAILTGHLEGPDLAGAIASADVLIHPSRTEAFGNVMLEAMAAGLAVVASATQSAQALIEHGRSGLLCPPEDIDCFVAEVARLAGDAQARSALGEAARIASAAFRWDDAAESVIRAYRSLARINAGPVPA